MNSTLPAYLGGIVRLITAIIGGWLAQKGLADEGTVDTIAGSAVIVVTGIWSIWAKRKALITPPPASSASVSTPPPIAPIALIALLPLLPLLPLLTGCAVMWNRTPIMSESKGETVVSDAVTLKWGFGTKDATTADRYKLSSDGGLDISGLSLKSDSSASLIQGMQLGIAMVDKYLQMKGLAPEASADAEDTPTVTPAAAKVKVPKATPKKTSVKKAKASAASPEAETSADPSSDLRPPTSDLSPSPSGYTGTPAADGSGVYGRPSCSRCRAYKTAHADVPIINLDEPANRVAMWAALRRLGFTGTTADLPVVITATEYTQAAN